MVLDCTSRHFDQFQTYFEDSIQFPSLQTLVISGSQECTTCACTNDYDRLMDGLGILIDVFPVLTTLHLDRVPYTIPSSLLRRLKHLKIMTCPMTHTICQQIFSNSGMLESLEIRDLMEIQDSLEDDSFAHLFQMPSLREVVLQHVPIELVKCVLDSCACPSLYSLSIGHILDDDRLPEGDAVSFAEALDLFVCCAQLIQLLA